MNIYFKCRVDHFKTGHEIYKSEDGILKGRFFYVFYLMFFCTDKKVPFYVYELSRDEIFNAYMKQETLHLSCKTINGKFHIIGRNVDELINKIKDGEK